MKLSELLKEKTTHAHTQAEEGLPLFKADFNKQDYTAMIQRMLSLYNPLEKTLTQHLQHESALELDKRMVKTTHLKADLKELDSPESDMTTIIPEIPNPLQALGVLYVVEGSTLGGQIISKNFVTRLGLDDSQVQFFKGYGPQTGVMWQRFKAHLDAQDFNQEQTEQVIAGANKAFEFVTASMRSP